MKFSFSDNMVKSTSFIDLCNIAQNYGFDGIEICDVENEISQHSDSIFRSSATADAKRKLINRHISIPVLSFNQKVNEQNVDQLIKYVEHAGNASVDGVVIDGSSALDDDSNGSAAG